MAQFDSCPIYKATGQIGKVEDECNHCPFRDNCIEDILNDAVAKVIKILGDYIKKKQ